MYQRFIKRALDILVALIALPFFVLVFIVIAPIIKLTDGGPVFYNAPRRGKNGKVFKMFKFRSMYVNSPDLRNADGSTFNSSNDPRVTKIGKIIRKTSLDEIPQLLNVLIGDMSLVGPRPNLAGCPYEEIPEHIRIRYQVRPGITGYAQAYYRNSITASEKYHWDAFYVENVSLLLDLRILVKTVVSVLKRENIFVTEEKPHNMTEEQQTVNK